MYLTLYLSFSLTLCIFPPLSLFLSIYEEIHCQVSLSMALHMLVQRHHLLHHRSCCTIGASNATWQLHLLHDTHHTAQQKGIGRHLLKSD